ncbi:MAG: helix-turn-helix domain-containing protein [Actinomycetota bacterium]|nr:helix-turn-helix domain-containing protein [Actinomycetota bacterium]
MTAPRWGQDSLGGQASARPPGPTALRIVLGTQLRRLREASRITGDAAARAIRASHAKISRMELGRVAFREHDVRDLLTLYGVTDEQDREAFLTLARRANIPGWWHQYNDIVPSWFETYLGLEEVSSVIRTYQPQLVPGLLQTPAVARMIIMLGHSNASRHDIERRVSLRMTRREILTKPDPPHLWAVVEEVSLWRLDNRSVMREQIEHLIEVAQLPNVTIQVAPIYSSAHPALGGPFSILRFSDPDLPDIVYLEQLSSAVYLDKKEEIQHYRAIMDRLCIAAKSPPETVDFFEDMLKKL